MGNEAPLCIRSARILDGRVHVHTERVPNASDADVLIEAVLVAVFRQYPDVPLAVHDLVLAGRVIGYVRVRDVLDMPDNTVKDLRNFNVRLVVSGDDLTRRPILPLVVRDLLDVLRQLVDGKARARVDRLPLHRAARRQYVGGPLPLIVRRPGGEPQVVQFILAGFAVRGNRNPHATASCFEQVLVRFFFAHFLAVVPLYRGAYHSFSYPSSY